MIMDSTRLNQSPNIHLLLCRKIDGGFCLQGGVERASLPESSSVTLSVKKQKAYQVEVYIAIATSMWRNTALTNKKIFELPQNRPTHLP